MLPGSVGDRLPGPGYICETKLSLDSSTMDGAQTIEHPGLQY
jgi:hypothetical protein